MIHQLIYKTMWKRSIFRSAWVAQPVKCPTLDFGSGSEIEPHAGLCARHGGCLGFSLSLPPPPPSPCGTLSLKQTKPQKFTKEYTLF